MFGAGGQLYVRDLPSNRTFLVSRGDGDGPPGDAVSFDPSISDDGSRVAFDSEAKNLGGGATGNVTQVYVREVDAAHTVLVSRVNGAAGAPGDDDSRDPSISGDGRRVAFESFADNLGDGDTDDSQDVHIRDIDGGTTTLVDIGATGAKFDRAASPAVSGDGNRVAFLATTAGDSDVYVRDLAANQLILAGRADGAGGVPVTVDAAPGLVTRRQCRLVPRGAARGHRRGRTGRRRPAPVRAPARGRADAPGLAALRSGRAGGERAGRTIRVRKSAARADGRRRLRHVRLVRSGRARRGEHRLRAELHARADAGLRAPSRRGSAGHRWWRRWR